MRQGKTSMKTQFVYAGILFVACYCSASKILFEATPEAIAPYLSKTLTLRCSVETETETVIGRRHAAKRVTETVTSHADVNHVTSIIVTRVSAGSDQNVTVATMSSYEPASAKVDGDKVRVTGTTEPSTTSGEKGYLELTWTHPLQDQAGVYVCEVFALNSNLHPEALRVSVNIEINDVGIPELINFISENDRKIETLQSQLDQYRSQIGPLDNGTQSLTDQNKVKFDAIGADISNLKMAANNLTNRNIQMGNITCTSSSSVMITFDRPYDSPPAVFLAFDSLALYQDIVISPRSINIQENGFTVSCTWNSYTRAYGVGWLALNLNT
ncbi:uncharacterized protein LOC131945085 [Physella acuta]|uniref:uncharacterized protein LOC131945085 n=1 Tax=Physella acuta TaxID=109671 RepID=UPI0027DAEF54|nr:uncharacterized protein LOC131945085 [Physella acuta]